MVRNRLTAVVRKALLVFGVASLTVACNKGTGPAPAETEHAHAHEDAPAGPVEIQLLKQRTDLPPFSITDLDGKQMSSADWKGKVVLINFWATWCGPCRAEIPDLVALQNEYKDQVIVIGVSEDEGPVDAVRKFATQYKVNYPIAMTTAEMQKLFPGISALPTTFMLDKEGRVAQKHVGLLRARETEAAARFLAGLETDVQVKLIEDPSRMNAEDVAQLKEVPGVDLSKVPDDKRSAVLQALNSDSCTCGCGLTVAKCRVDDPTCSVSPGIAKAIVEKTLATR
jgi:thiol-disulfide isomerase/thioredoxin